MATIIKKDGGIILRGFIGYDITHHILKSIGDTDLSPRVHDGVVTMYVALGGDADRALREALDLQDRKGYAEIERVFSTNRRTYTLGYRGELEITPPLFGVAEGDLAYVCVQLAINNTTFEYYNITSEK